MCEYVITINSTSDLPKEWVWERKIPVVPLNCTIGGNTYRDMYDLSEQIEASIITEMLADLPYPEDILIHTGEVTKQLFQKAIEQGHNFRIVFSGSRVSALTEGLEISLKNALYEKCPNYRTDLRANILITILVQGCYHAYEQYSTIDQDRVVAIISKIADEISKDCE